MDLRCIMQVELIRFVDELDLGNEGQRGSKDEFQVFGVGYCMVNGVIY